MVVVIVGWFSWVKDGGVVDECCRDFWIVVVFRFECWNQFIIIVGKKFVYVVFGKVL